MASNKKNSRMVRLPNDIADLLDEMAAQLNESYEAGKTRRSLNLTDQGKKGTWVPKSEVIRIALEDLKKKNSR